MSRSITSTGRRAGRHLVDDVVDELSGWNPREFIAAFARMHQGRISLMHLNVLVLLEATGPLPMNRLAEALDISVASVTGVVDRMEARGLVLRRRDADDRRVILVEPADGGRQVFAEIDAKRRQGLGALLEQLSDKDLQGLLDGHRALRRARAQMDPGLAARHADDTVARAKASRTDRIEAMFARGRAPRADAESAR